MICERCGKGTRYHIMSVFNTELICLECKKDETEHPIYKKAVKTEEEECKKGNYNFSGIGLPSK